MVEALVALNASARIFISARSVYHRLAKAAKSRPRVAHSAKMSNKDCKAALLIERTVDKRADGQTLLTKEGRATRRVRRRTVQLAVADV